MLISHISAVLAPSLLLVSSDVELVRTEEFLSSKLITLYRLISSRSTVLPIEESFHGVHEGGKDRHSAR
jgi:hypothetical protein